MPTHEHQTPGQSVDTSSRDRPNRSLSGPGADQELEREMLARQAAMGPVAASPPPEDNPGSWIPSWFTEMLAVDGAASSGPPAPGGASSSVSGSASADRDGLKARGTAISSYEDGRASAITGAGHWSQEEGLSGDVAATRAQSTTFADSDTSWERTDHAASGNASYGSDGWSAEASKSSGLTSHYDGHEVSTASRTAVTGTQDGIGINNQSSHSVDDDGVRSESQRDSSMGWSWEHGLNLGFGSSSVVSDGDDFNMANNYGMSYDRGVAQGSAGNSSHVVDSDGQVLDSANNYTAGWDMEHGFLGSASQSSSVVDGDDYQRRQSSLAFSGQEGLAAGMTTASRQTDDDGVIRTDDRSASASWSRDAQAVSMSRATSRDDDGIVRSTDSQGTFGYSEEAGLTAAASTSRVLSDGDDFSLARSADMAFSADGGHAGLTSTSHVVDSDGVTHDGSQSSRLGWDPLGFLAEYRQSQNTSEGEDYNRRESTLGYDAGAFNAGSTFGSRNTADDGTVCNVDTAYSGSLGPDGAQVSGSHARGTSWDGITGGTSSQATLGRDADGNVSWSGSTQRGIADNEEYHDRTGATASYQDGLFTAQGTSDVRYTDADSVRRDRERAAGMTFGNGSAGLTASQQTSTLDDGIGVNTRNTGSATAGPDGEWSLGGIYERSVSMDEDYGTTRGVGGNIRHDGFDLNASDTARWSDMDGTANTSSSVVTAGIRDGNANMGGQWSSSAKLEDGSSSQQSRQVGMSTDGTFSAGMGSTQRDTNGDVTGGHSLGGSADLLGDQRRVTGTGSVTRGKQTFSAGGGVEYEVNTPEQRGNDWVVTYRQGISINAGGSATQGGGENTDTGMTRAGVSGGLSAGAEVATSGVRTFGSEAEAIAFYEHPTLGLMDGPSSSIAEVRAMREGDSASSLMTGTLGAHGSGSWGPFLTASAGVQGGASTGMTVERGTGETISVTVEDASTLAGTLGLSTIGVGMSGGLSERDFEAVTWTFDLSKPNAREAYTAYVGEGQTPIAGDGVVMASVTVGETETETATFTLPGASASISSGTETAVTTEADGDVIERDTGHSGFSGSASLFGWSASEDHSMDFIEIGDERRVMAAQSRVNHSNAGANYSGLARAAGVPGEANTIDGNPSGAYTYDTTFPEESMDAFILSVENGSYNPHSGMMIDDAGEDMQAAIRDARGDRDVQRRVLAEFMEDSGDEGIHQIRGEISGAQGFLHLEGSDAFVGVQGHAELSEQISRAAERLRSGTEVRSAYEDLVILQGTLEFMRSDASDYSKYIDVPDPVRTTEIIRIGNLQERVTILITNAASSLIDQGGADVLYAPNTIANDNGRLGDVFDASRAAEQRMTESANQAHTEKSLHEDDKMSPARDELGSDGLWTVSWLGGGSEEETYQVIDALWPAAYSKRREAHAAKRAAQSTNLLNEADADVSIGYWLDAARHFDNSDVSFMSLVEKYRAIQSRHADQTHLWR